MPAPVAGFDEVTALAASRQYTCAATASGTLSCWGENQYGQLGDGTTTDRWLPTPVAF